MPLEIVKLSQLLTNYTLLSVISFEWWRTVYRNRVALNENKNFLHKKPTSEILILHCKQS